MNPICKDAFNKAKYLIEKRKKMYGCDSTPVIQEFDGGNVFFQYFENWEDLSEKMKKRAINLVSPVDGLKSIHMIYSENKNESTIKIYENKKIYVVLEGEIDFHFTDHESIKVEPFQTIEIPEHKAHGWKTIKDTYVIIVER